jgi:hypothetical protein
MSRPLAQRCREAGFEIAASRSARDRLVERDHGIEVVWFQAAHGHH